MNLYEILKVYFYYLSVFQQIITEESSVVITHYNISPFLSTLVENKDEMGTHGELFMLDLSTSAELVKGSLFS